MPKKWKKSVRTGPGAAYDKQIRKKIHSGWFGDTLGRLDRGAVVVLCLNHKTDKSVWIVKTGRGLEERRSFGSEKELKGYMVISGIEEISRISL